MGIFSEIIKDKNQPIFKGFMVTAKGRSKRNEGTANKVDAETQTNWIGLDDIWVEKSIISKSQSTQCTFIGSKRLQCRNKPAEKESFDPSDGEITERMSVIAREFNEREREKR